MLVGLSTVGLYIYLGLYLVIKPLFMSFDREVETSLSHPTNLGYFSAHFVMRPILMKP